MVRRSLVRSSGTVLYSSSLNTTNKNLENPVGESDTVDPKPYKPLLLPALFEELDRVRQE